MFNKAILGTIHFILLIKTIGIKLPIEITQLLEKSPWFMFLLSYVYIDSLLDKPIVSGLVTSMFCVIIYRKDIWDEIVATAKLL